MIPVALTIAGSDPSGGAGIQADLKTFHQFGVYGMAAITLLTIQNTLGIKAVHVIHSSQVARQIEAVMTDIFPKAVKTGALGNAQNILAVAHCAKKFKFLLIVDPVVISKHGVPLLGKSAIDIFKKELLPHARLVTPNLSEASMLSGIRVNNLESMEKAARLIAGLGSQAVLVKGGHLRGQATDLLYDQGRVRILKAHRIPTHHTHGTGCAFSAAITAELAKGRRLLAAVLTAKEFITEAIRTAVGIGKGIGPVNHFAAVSKQI